jgi:hypothetical protein
MNRARLSRPIYIIARFAEMLIAAGSRVLNAAVFGGSTHQTTSARAFIDGMTSPKWAKRQRAIDTAFWFQPNHCKTAWLQEVDAAQKTLERARVPAPANTGNA